MDDDISSVDVLTMALSAARMLRSSGDMDGAIAGAYAALGREAPVDTTPVALRVVRLILDTHDDRGRLYDVLRQIERPLSWNRPLTEASESARTHREDDEATQYAKMLTNDQLGTEISMFWRGDAYPSFPSFRLLERSSVQWFYGPTIVVRDGRELSASDAAPPEAGDEWRVKTLDLPKVVRGLITYPFDVPTLFDIETGAVPWDVWEICCSFADQYMKMYERPDEYGVWGHDLSELWIENLLYYPDHQIIHPHVGS